MQNEASLDTAVLLDEESLPISKEINPLKTLTSIGSATPYIEMIAACPLEDSSGSNQIPEPFEVDESFQEESKSSSLL